MFQVQGKYKSSTWEVLAERNTSEEADQVYGKLRVEYGPEWMLLVVNKGGGGAWCTGVDFMLKFAGDMDDSTASANQMRCLWTAWCLMNDMNTDTKEYDAMLRNLWDHVSESAKESWRTAAAYHDEPVDVFDMFDLFMGEFLC